VVPEPLGGAHRDMPAMAAQLKERLLTDLAELRLLTVEQLLEQRYQRLMGYGYC